MVDGSGGVIDYTGEEVEGVDNVVSFSEGGGAVTIGGGTDTLGGGSATLGVGTGRMGG